MMRCLRILGLAKPERFLCSGGRVFRPGRVSAPAGRAHLTTVEGEISLSQVGRALDLLGQAAKSAAPARLRAGHEPNLEVAWGSFHQGIGSSLIAIFSRSNVPKRFLRGGFFRDCWIEGRIPRRAWLPPPCGTSFSLSCRSRSSPPQPPHYPRVSRTPNSPGRARSMTYLWWR